MSTGPADASDREARLDAVIAAYIESRDAGQNPDPNAWLARHPDLAPELEQYFQGEDLVDWLVATAVPAEPGRASRFGRYRVVRMIGRGGMGSVYEAIDPRSGRRVALKVLPTCGLPDPLQRERFEREARVIAGLDHPNIVPLLDVGEQAGIPYVTMPLVDGPNLRVVLRRLRKAETPESFPVAVPGAPGETVALASDAPRWRAAALIGLQAANGLAHAHERGVLHRDIKPSNLLLGADGTLHVTDFGLARSSEHPDLTETGDLAGTLRYMAPERFRRWCDPRSDLYGLGLTLYELLTLRLAFDAPDRSRLLRALLEDHPPRPRAFARDIPRDLETIVLTLIAKEPGHRYPSAADLAADLQRFLDGRPIRARRPSAARRLWSWAKRHKARAFGLLFVALTLLGAVLGVVAFLQMRAEEARYQTLLVQAQQSRIAPRVRNWSQRSLSVIREAARIHHDLALRDQAVACLTGLDIGERRLVTSTGASSVVFDPSGEHLLLGGFDSKDQQDQRAKLLTVATGTVDLTDQPGPGPVAYRADGTPVQLHTGANGEVVLRDLAHHRDVVRFTVPGGRTASVLAISDDARFVAAAAAGSVYVWDVDAVRLIRTIAADSTALALAPDGSMLATGDAIGAVGAWSLPDGVIQAEFRHDLRGDLSLTITRDPRWSPTGERGWLLAVGDGAASLVVYDVTARQKRVQCRGVSYLTQALSFNSDGTLLLSGGRAVMLWDAATGELVLNLGGGGGNVVGVAFASDSRQLAVVTSPHFIPGVVEICNVEQDRGLFKLRGLAAPVSRIAISPDATRAAALAQDWRVAVWDLTTRRLLGVIDAPRGDTADNSALAFSPDGRRLAVSAGSEVHLWDLAAGRRLKVFPLNPALDDGLAYTAPDHLLSFRAERDRPDRPRVGRLRDLFGPDPLHPLFETQPYSGRIYGAVLSPDGRYIAEDSVHTGPSGPEHRVRVHDCRDGTVILDLLPVRPGGDGFLMFDPTGTVLSMELGEDRMRLYEIPSGRLRGHLETARVCLGPDAQLWCGKGDLSISPGRGALSLCQGTATVLATFAIDEGTADCSPTFSRDGRLLAYGSPSGIVTVVDIDRLRSRLRTLGLDW
jgi:eukaryotic-like serine/threonine-protein kinase